MKRPRGITRVTEEGIRASAAAEARFRKAHEELYMPALRRLDIGHDMGFALWCTLLAECKLHYYRVEATISAVKRRPSVWSKWATDERLEFEVARYEKGCRLFASRVSSFLGPALTLIQGGAS